jgi:feruloyl esterase
MSILSRRLGFGLAAVSFFGGIGSAAAATCESLSMLSLPHTTVMAAQAVPPGAFVPAKPFSMGTADPQPYKDLRAFCRVSAQLRPTQDSLIKFEVWMPIEGWNGKFLEVGNGGFSGEIWYPAMVQPLTQGYAIASTDTGHEGSVSDVSFALNHPEKWIDFSYRAIHETALEAKAIIQAYYGGTPKHSYWSGCSTGGRQGLMEAQRYPADFDGIVAGAPANHLVTLSARYLWVAQALHRDASSFIPPDKLLLLHDAVLKACDAMDGVQDGVLENPARCTFDPQVLACRGTGDGACLTASQIDAARAVYAPWMNPRTKQMIWPGLAAGSELGWATGVGQVTPQPMALALGIFQYVAFKNPNWDWRSFDFDKDLAFAAKSAAAADAGPNLKAYFDRGGKLLQYHGWADPGISPQTSIDYFKSVLTASGGAAKLADAYRLFMVPGMAHCRGGEGPDRFDAVSALDQWVDQKKAPEQLLTSRLRNGTVDRTRPLCVYPQVAMYKGSGSTDDAANFACKSPPP